MKPKDKERILRKPHKLYTLQNNSCFNKTFVFSQLLLSYTVFIDKLFSFPH